jgi:hypothetical protein
MAAALDSALREHPLAAQEVRAVGDIHRNHSRLILAEQLGRSWPVSQGELAVAAVDAARCEAGFVHLGNFPDGRAGFGAAGLTSWSMTIRTSGAQQMGDAAVAGRTLGGGELGAVHCSPPAL